MVSTLHLQLKVLGGFRLLRGDEPVLAVASARVQALLGFLALRQGSPQSRAYVASLFWPDSTEEQSLTNLRHLLHELRKLLPETDEFLRIEHRSLCWKPDAPVSLDVDEFNRCRIDAEEAGRQADPPRQRAALERAAGLYQGELLPSCTQEWVLADRERLRRDCVTVLQQLVRLTEDAREYAVALGHAHRLQGFDPTHEATLRTRMRLHMLAGDRAAALAVYKEGVGVLRRELAVGPGAALRELHDRLLAGGSLDPPGADGARTGEPPVLPLHGRNREWLQLRAAWTKSAAGCAQLLVLVGEAGIGKTRLADELCRWVERQGGAAARTRSYAAEGRLAFAPAAQWLRTPSLRAALTRLEAPWLAEVAHILPELRIEQPSLPAAQPGRELWQRHRLFEALSRALLAGQAPTLLLLDDLQWTDLETLEWLRFLLRFAPGAPLLVVGTLRSEELTAKHPLQHLFQELGRDGQITQLPLGRLNAMDAAFIAADVARRPLTGAEAAWLYRETEGNPLFVVECVQAGMPDRVCAAAAAGAPATTPLPPKVHAVIYTRLAQLSAEAREVAAAAAVIGRAFTFVVLAAVCGRFEDDLVPAVDELWHRRIVRELEPGAYDFTHDKLREVTYAETSAPRRRALHRRTAEVLERLHGDELEAVSAQVAAHFEEAGRPDEAIERYRRSADAAKRVHANEEAIRLYQKALALIDALPPSAERAAQALDVTTALGACLVASHGYPNADVIGMYARAIELCRRLGRPTQAPILRANAIASLTTGNTRRAEALGRELLALHANDGDPVAEVEGYYVLGVSYFWMGRFADSRSSLERSIDSFDVRHRETHLALYAQDPQAVCLCRLAWTLCFLGLPEQSAARLEAALALAREIQHPHTEAYVCCIGAMIRVELGDCAGAGRLLDELEDVTSRHRLGFWENRGRIMRCFLQAETSGAPEDLAQAADCMATYAAAGNVLSFSQFQGWRCRAHLAQGEIGPGLAALDEAFALLGRIDERYYLPELHRLRGELLCHQGAAPAVVESHFQVALELSREQGAKRAELRAAMSLARLWQAHRKGRAAHALLAGIYAAFTEGFTTPDLKEARRLLDQWA